MDDNEKLMEEVKLYWLIQISVAAGVGFSIKNLLPGINESVKNLGEVFYIWSIIVVVSLLAAIGFSYNLLGTYHIFCCRINARDDKEHETSITTPLINHAYIVLMFLLWGNAGYRTVDCYREEIGIPASMVSVSLLSIAGAALFYWIGKGIVQEFYVRNEKYAVYAKKLLLFYFVKKHNKKSSRPCRLGG